MQKKRVMGFALGVVTLIGSYITYAQREVMFRQVARLPAGSREGEVLVKVNPDKTVVVPRLLPPDADGFWVTGEVKGGIVRLNRSGELVTILRQRSYGLPSVNSLGQLAIHVRKGKPEMLATYTDEIHIYSSTGQKLGEFIVKGCSQCKHPYLQTMIGLDDKQRVWLRFLSSERTVDEDPNQKACTVAFDLHGRLVQHLEGAWGVDVKGRLRRRTKSIGGNFIIVDPETMNTNEIPVPVGWQGFLVGIDPNRDLIWWRCWRLDDIKTVFLMAFGKQGIVAMLPIPTEFLGAQPSQKILSSEVVIGADGRLYVAQCTKEAFYIFKADMSFLKR